jgi:hypothetical protein
MHHIEEVACPHAVIMIQVENELGSLGDGSAR